MKTALQSLRFILFLTLLTGVVYPLVVTGFAQVLFSQKANGSLLVTDGKIVGSALLAQKFDQPGYFWPRPSGADYATVASGATNKGPTSADLVKAIAERRAKLGPDAPDDLLTSSGSGLDPHLSPAGAKFQIPRIAAVRKLPAEKLNALVDQFTAGPQLGILGEPRVNVLALNRALDSQNNADWPKSVKHVIPIP
jgi:K+-transporting ATPase ATPase C chain